MSHQFLPYSTYNQALDQKNEFNDEYVSYQQPKISLKNKNNKGNNKK